MKKFIGFVCVILTVSIVAATFAACSTYKKLPEEVTLDAALEEGGYSLVFEDNFDGDKVDTTKWKMGYGSSVRRAGYYEVTPDTVFVKDGNLTIRTLYKDGQYGEGWYTSWLETSTKGGQPTATSDYEGFSSTYGYFEVRCKVPASEGIWSAFWLMPDGATGMTANDVQNSGADGVEIDIMESPWIFNKREQNLNVHVLHGDGYGDRLKSQRSDTYIVPDMYTTFHTYGLMWTEDEYIFYMDGRETWRTTHVVDGINLGVSQVNEYMLLTVEVAGYQDEQGNLHPGKELTSDGKEQGYWCGNPENNDKNKHYDFVVDYVKVWKK